MKRKIPLLILLCHSGILFSAGTTYTWTANTTGENWNTTADWNPNTDYPHVTDDTAVLGSSITSSQTIHLNVSSTVGTINFNNGNNYTIDSTGGTFTFQVSSGSAAINVTNSNGNGAHTISANLSLAQGLVINQASTGTFTLSGTIGESVASSLTKSGSGTLSLTGNNSSGFSGGLILQAGTLSITSNNALGATNSAVTISGGTFQVGGAVTLPSTRTFTLSGNATFDTNGNSLTIQGVISSTGSLTVSSSTGSGTLILSGNNTYSGGTQVGTSSTLSIGADANLGNTSGGLTLNGGTLAATASFSSARAITLTGSNTFSTGANTLTLTGVVSGSGSFTKTGAGTLVLAPVTSSGANATNTYAGGITVSAGTLQGNTNSLIGNIVNNGTVVFDQSFNGTYSGTLTGSGGLTKQGSGVLALSGSSASFSGATSVTAGTLNITGSLAGSTITVSSGATLTGTGTMGSVTNNGNITNGSAGSNLTISGTLTSGGSSTTTVNLSPSNPGKIVVSGTANLNGTLVAVPASGFYGFASNFTVLSANTVAGTFSSLSINNSNFTGTLAYTSNSVILTLTSIQPFINFPYSNKNTQRVGENINAIAAANTLNSDIDLKNILNTFTGLSNSAINAALDQMHPAQLSAYAELQFEVGGQLLSLFHHKPFLICGCDKSNRIWIEPYGNWFHRKSHGKNLGFHATTRGFAFGVDGTLVDGWTLGFGGAWNVTDLDWSNHRGYAYSRSLYGAIYTDLFFDNFYLGASVYGGNEWNDSHRHILFTTINRHAEGQFNSLDIAGQLTTAYYFGTPIGFVYPYATADYFYLRSHGFKEKGADSLNLTVDVYRSGTLRTEAGIAFQTNDKNYNETICISPLVGFGWVLEKPMRREDFVSRLAYQTIPFKSQGWNEATQLLNLKFGLGITYKCFNLGSEYLLEISPDGGSPFFNQRANFRFNLNF